MSRSRRTWRRALRGAASVGLVAVVVSGCTTTSYTDPPLPSHTGGLPLPTGTSALPSPIGFHWDQSKADAWTPFLSTVPGTSTYFEFQWCSVEPTQGQRRWGPVDKAVGYAVSMHITMVLKIRVGSCWASSENASFQRGKSDKTESFMPKDIGLYEDFVRTVVKRYSPLGVHEYAIENEVNSQSYWAGSVADYEQLVRGASTAIHGADDAARVVDCGLSSTTYGYGIASRLLAAGDQSGAIAAWNAYYAQRLGTRGEKLAEATSVSDLQSMLGLEQGQRNLAYLDLISRLTRDHVVDVRQIHYYEQPAAIPLLLDYLDATTAQGVPIEAWEVGFFDPAGAGTAASPDTANTVVQSLALLLAGGVQRAIWLPLASNPDNKAGAEVRSGILDPSGAERPAAATVRLMVDASRDATITPVPTTRLEGAAFAAVGGGTTLVLWAPTGTVTLPLQAGDTLAALGARTPTPTSSADIGSSAVILQSTQSPDKVLSGLR